MSEETKMSSDEVEIRFKTQGERLSILDAYCQATGKCRTEVMVGLLEKWSADQVHVASMVLNVIRRNPSRVESIRNE